MGRDGQMRLQPTRRKILLGIGASAVAFRPSALRAADGIAPDRSGTPAIASPSTAADAVLYEEDPAEPNGVRIAGTVAWRADTVPGQNGAPSETIVRAHIAIPARGQVLDARFARNTDKSLPASHTIELKFALPENFAHGGIDSVPGLLMKAREAQRGVPLSGTTVKVTPLFFMMGLSAVEKDLAMNMALLRERNWFDLPMVYGDKKRAILAFAKGPDGNRAFKEAFATWDPPGLGKRG